MNPFENMDKTLILDADSVVFIACYNAEKDTLPEEFYETDGREKDIVALATKYARDFITNILDETGCQKVECYFTSGRESFRYKVDPTYKANRGKSKRVFGIAEVKEAIAVMYDGHMCTEYEADDICVLRAKQENTLLAAIDKDLLQQTAGTHYNYKKNEWIETRAEEAEKFLWVQMIQGDTADGIYGIEGMGRVKANKFLDEVEGPYKEAVWQLYKEAGKSRKEFISNLNLLDMHLLQEDGSIKLHLS